MHVSSKNYFIDNFYLAENRVKVMSAKKNSDMLISATKNQDQIQKMLNSNSTDVQDLLKN